MSHTDTRYRFEEISPQRIPQNPHHTNITASYFNITASCRYITASLKQARKISKKKLFFARRFQTIFKQKCSYLIPLLSITFPQGFRISKNIGHPTLGNGGKKTFKRYLKSEQTDRQTHRRTDKSTYRLNRPRGLIQ